MKTFFLSIFTALASFFGFGSHAVQSPANAPVVRTQTVASSSATASITTSHPSAAADAQVAYPVVTFPTSSDVLHPGQKYTVTWQDTASNTTSYSIDLEVAAGGNYYVMMSLGTAGPWQRSIGFTVPSGMAPRTNYQISFSDASKINDVIFRSQGFTIK